MYNRRYNTAATKSAVKMRRKGKFCKTKIDILRSQINSQKKLEASLPMELEEHIPLKASKKTTIGKQGNFLTPDQTKILKIPETDAKQRRSSRLKLKQELAGLSSATVDSDPEDSDENVSDDESEETSDEERISSAVNDASKKSKNGCTFSEAYFTAHKRSQVTSNKTLSSVKLERTNMNEIRETVQNIPEYHKEEKAVLFERYYMHFEKWSFLLQEGFNVLTYGVGSKQCILNKFCKDFLTDELYVVVHGFFPSLTVKHILNSITEEALGYEGKFSSVQDHAEYVKRYFTEGEEDLYVIIHSIDGVALRSVKCQSILSSLASAPNIHFLCSADHINSPLIWDQIMLSQFKWTWFDVSTFEPYIMETSYENSLLRDQSSHLVLSSLLYVFNSLTPNSRGVFMILAKHQKKEQKKSSCSGITFNEWYQECREAFLVNSEMTMQAQISEFRNHKLLSFRKNIDGVEMWYIPVDSATLEQFLESCE